MDCVQTIQNTQLKMTAGIAPNESLWKRAPTRTPDGSPVCDFMLLIPGLNKRGKSQITDRVGRISAVLIQFEHIVVFADLNMKLNLLWVSYKPKPGTSIEIARAIQKSVPEAKMIAMKFD